ncbi:MAG: hypothetical protein RR364_01865 [Lachnospiraceae bacterium]
MRKKEMKKLYNLEYEMNHKGKVVEKAVYVGEYYQFQQPGYTKRQVTQRIVIFSIIITASIIGAALLNTESTRNFFIGVPYVCLFLPVCYMLIGTGSFFTAPERMNKIEYAHSILRTQRSMWGIIWLQLYSILAGIVFLIVKFSEIALWREIIFVGMNGISLLFCWVQIKYIQKACATVKVESTMDQEEPK